MSWLARSYGGSTWLLTVSNRNCYPEWSSNPCWWCFLGYPLVMTNIAMENGPVESSWVFPFKMVDLSSSKNVAGLTTGQDELRPIQRWKNCLETAFRGLQRCFCWQRFGCPADCRWEISQITWNTWKFQVSEQLKMGLPRRSQGLSPPNGSLKGNTMRLMAPQMGVLMGKLYYMLSSGGSQRAT